MFKKKFPDEDKFQDMIDKITKDKQDRQKNLENFKKRKIALEITRNNEIEPKRSINTEDLSNPRKTMSSERDERNIKIYGHLYSPKANDIKTPKLKHLNRIEEQDLYMKTEMLNNQKNKLKLLDKRARYAGLVREIFVPSIDLHKRQEIEERIGMMNNMTKSANNSKGNSLERSQNKAMNNGLGASMSYERLEKSESRIIQNAAKATLESPRGLGNNIKHI
ncbi:hypothetical protein SteCoe_28716 [Stentor coeruleus]|uniref:Uncharacterized protein n=1 Tax=Stentor coeruleus TaxID=5963 RepID=A0A1R2B7L4_9CILI|nr:hypothetical protein SteCoe_28716 [Stentor coeruleus]